MYVEFPREDGVLKVSQRVKDRAVAWVEGMRESLNKQYNFDTFKELNARMSTDEFRTMNEICSGLSAKDASALRSRITKFIKNGLIERQGCDRKYSYRLVERIERYGKRSVLRNLNAQKADKRRGL